MTAAPSRYAVVGHPVAHSQSPFIHAAGPYGRFTPGMRKQADQLAIPSRFRFTREDGLEATLSGR